MTIFNKPLGKRFQLLRLLRLIVPYLLGFLILEGVFGTIFWRSLKEKEDSLYTRNIKALENTYSVIIDNYKLASQIIYDEVINKPDVINLLQQAQGANSAQRQTVRQRLLKTLSPAYKRLNEYNLRQLHFHLPDSTSFLRFHSPDKFGDSLLGVRTSVRLANQEKRFVYGFEEGRIYNGFRYVFPLFAPDPSVTTGKVHLGSVETSVSFSAFKNEMELLFPGCFTLMIRRDLVEASLFEDKKSNYTPSGISDLFVVEKVFKVRDEGKLNCQVVPSLNQHLKPMVAPRLEQKKAFSQVISSTEGTPYVVTFIPVKNFEQNVVAYIISYSQDRGIQEHYQTFYWSLIGLTGSSLLIIGFTAFAHRSYRLLRCSNQVLQQEIAARITAEDREREKATQLLEALNQLKSQARLVQTEKMGALNRLVAGIAHEINNPISFIQGNIRPAREYLDFLLTLIDQYQNRGGSDPTTLGDASADADLEFIRQDFPRLLASMRHGAERVRDIVQTLRNFSRLDESGLKLVNLHEGLESSLVMLTHRLKPRDRRTEIAVVRDYVELPPVECYPGLLNQAFLSVLTNAVDALDMLDELQPDHPGGGDERPAALIHLKTMVLSDNMVSIAIANNGPPIAPEIGTRIFDPFFTTKPVGKGTGLGLSTAHAIVVEHHNGTLTYESTVGGETIFTIKIPMMQTSSAISWEHQASPRPPMQEISR